jgi:actin-related protein 6
VLDSGFSFTHAIPVVDGYELAASARRLNLGGKALTNHLKELVSFRSWNMMNETAVVNAVKERLCFVSQDFSADLRLCKDKRISAILREYLLPDFSRGGIDPLGHIRQRSEELDGSEQILVMNNERITVPELLFQPSDVGLYQAGLAELIVQAVESAPARFRAALYSNVVLSGGNCRFPGFRERLNAELRPLVSEFYAINVFMDENPMLTAYWCGMHALLHSESVPLRYVSKAEYEESGSSLTAARFASRDAT